MYKVITDVRKELCISSSFVGYTSEGKIIIYDFYIDEN